LCAWHPLHLLLLLLGMQQRAAVVVVVAVSTAMVLLVDSRFSCLEPNEHHHPRPLRQRCRLSPWAAATRPLLLLL
jgi:hypothetical protein